MFRSLHLALSHALYHYNNNVEIILISCLSDKKVERQIKRQFYYIKQTEYKKVLQNQAEKIFCKTKPTYNGGFSSKKQQQLMLKPSDFIVT